MEGENLLDHLNTVDCPECGTVITQNEANAFDGMCESCYEMINGDEDEEDEPNTDREYGLD